MNKFLSILIFCGFCTSSFGGSSFQLGELVWTHNYGTNPVQQTIQIPSGYIVVSANPDIRGNAGAQTYFNYSSAGTSVCATPFGSKPIGTYKGRLNVTLQDSISNVYPNCWILLTEKVAASTRFFSSASAPYFYFLEGSSFTEWEYYPATGQVKNGTFRATSSAAPAGINGPFGVAGTCNGIETRVYASFGVFPGMVQTVDAGAPFSFSGVSGAEIITIPEVDLSEYPFNPAWGWFYTGGAGPGRSVWLQASYANITTYSIDADQQTWGSHDSPDQPDSENPDPDKTKANTDEPINFITGNNHFAGPELAVPAAGISLSFALTYNSSETNGTAIGVGWHHSYDWSLTEYEDRIAVCAGDARVYSFAKEGNNIYASSFDNNWKLIGQTNGEHTLLLPGAIAYRFDANGVLQQIADGWSNAVSLVYSNGRLASVEHSSGPTLEFSYFNGLLSAVTAATNLNISFTYDAAGTLTGTVRQAGAELFSESCNYNSSLLLTQRVDAVGSDYRYTYSTNSKATGMSLTDGGWYEHTVEYSNASSRVTYFKEGEALVHDYDYNDTTKRVLEERFASVTGKVTYAYDNGGNVTNETTRAANTNHWMQMSRQYDDRHNVTNEAFGLSATPTNITKYTWHPEWQVPTSITDPEGFKQEYEYTNGVIAKERIYLSSNTTAETTFGYTTNGLLSAVTNANGHSTAFTYDSLGYPQSVIPQAGPIIAFGYDSLGHLTNSAVGGRQIGYTVSPLGWVERIDYADALYETFRYNGLGKVTNQVDRAGRVASYTYAPGGKLTAVSRQLGSTNVTVSYDFDQQFNTLAIRDELNRPVESYALDPLDRPTTVTNLEGQTMSIRYLVGEFVDSITRFDTTVVSNQYNGDGRLAAVHYSDETNRYTYLRNGLVRTLENSKGSVSNSWNSASWLTQTVASASFVTSAVNYAYSPDGNVTNAVVSIGGRQIGNSYSYDEAERLTNIVSGVQQFGYSYNTNNGLVASMICTNTGVQAEYEYDLLDRIRYITWKDSWGATILSFDYQYNAAGMITNRVIQTGVSGSAATGYGYDDLDRLTGVTTDSGLVEYSYDAAGNRQTKTGTDYSVDYTLGDGNRLASWSATSTNSFLSKRTLRVEGHSSEAIGTDNRWGQLYISNSVAMTPEINGTNFWINSFVTGLGTQQVVAAIRDQAGNMGYATNEIFLTVVTNAQYGYSAAGCLTNVSYSGTEYSDTKTLGWNAQYQLTSVSSATFAVEYSYDVLGRRSSRTVAGGGDPGSTNVEQYVYSGNQVVADLDGSGNMIRAYTWGSGIDNLLSMTVYSASETNVYYATKDVQNTVHALVDATGQIVERYEYEAWGRTTVFDAAGDELTESAVGNRYLWQGREYDSTTKLYYFRARWYDPVAGRWLSNDPAGISGGLNQYVAFNNSAVNFIDPDGLDFIYIVDANAVNGQGHAAVITGPVNGQWRYDSFGKPKGSHRHGQYLFSSEQSALNFAKQNDYTHFARWYTTPSQDAAAQARANLWHTGAGQKYVMSRPYEVNGDNCQTMVDDAADAAKIELYLSGAGIQHPNITMKRNSGGLADESGLLQ